jgi:hypothetical protein
VLPLLRLSFLHGNFLSWNDFVHFVIHDINRNGSIQGIHKHGDINLGSTDVNEWARGKKWAILTSIGYCTLTKDSFGTKGSFLPKVDVMLRIKDILVKEILETTFPIVFQKEAG